MRTSRLVACLGFCAALGVSTVRAQAPPFAMALDPVWRLDVWGTGIGRNGLLPVDLDGDGRLEIVHGISLSGSFTGKRIWRVARFDPADGEYGVLWSSPQTSADILRIAVVEIAGAPKVCVGLEDGRLQVYDGATRTLERESEIADRGLRAIVLADADNDGEQELIVATDSSVHLLDPETLDPQSSFELGGEDMAVGNVDADAAQEIVLSSGLVIEFDGIQADVQWDFSAFGMGSRLGLSDLDGDGMQEIVSAREFETIDVFDADLQTPKHRIPVGDFDALLLSDVTGDGRDEILYGEGQGGEIRAVDAVTFQPLWQTPSRLPGVTHLAIADVDADGSLELIWGAGFGATGSNELFVHDLASRAPEWRSGALEGPFAALAQGDVDDDGTDELVAISWESEGGYAEGIVHVFDAESLELEWRSESNGLGGSAGEIRDVAIGDVDRDGDTEIVLGSGRGFGEIFILDGESHALERQIAEFGRGTIQTLTLADLDADGGLEIVTLERDHIRVIDGATGAEEWASEDLDPRFPGGHAIEVADLDGDAWPEIVASLGYVVVVDGALRSVRKTGFVEMRGIDLADYDGDGRKEIWAGSKQGNLMRIDPLTLEVEVLDDVCEGALNSVRLERARNLAGSVQFACDEGIGIYGVFEREVLWRADLDSENGRSNNLQVMDLGQQARLIVGNLAGVKAFQGPGRDLTDADDDGVLDLRDNCPALVNPDQADADGNRIGDACNDGEDADGDEWADPLDNCPGAVNPDQGDRDWDTLGDACDRYPDNPDHTAARCEEAIANEALLSEALALCEARPHFEDADGDGEADATDVCAGTPAAVPVDAAGCSHAQFCARLSGSGVIGMSVCAASDWRNDEPLWSAGDCRVRLPRRFSWPIPFTCEAQ